MHGEETAFGLGLKIPAKATPCGMITFSWRTVSFVRGERWRATFPPVPSPIELLAQSLIGRRKQFGGGLLPQSVQIKPHPNLIDGIMEPRRGVMQLAWPRIGSRTLPTRLAYVASVAFLGREVRFQAEYGSVLSTHLSLIGRISSLFHLLKEWRVVRRRRTW